MTEQKSQLDRFKEAARELDADDDEAKFNESIKKLAKAGRKKLTGDSKPESMPPSGDES